MAIHHYEDPVRLRAGLLSTCVPVHFDTETSGLNTFIDRVLSYGFRISDGKRWTNHILYTDRCRHTSIQPHIIPDKTIACVMEALSSVDVMTGHNLKYDLAMLNREGFAFDGEARCTQGMLRMIDQDRGYGGDEGKSHMARFDMQAPLNSERRLNYKLKDIVGPMLGISPIHTPNSDMQVPNYERHSAYLCSDVFCTQRLHDHLWAKLTDEQKLHVTAVHSPLTKMLVEMSRIGVAADIDVANHESQQIADMMQHISDLHASEFGIALDSLDANGLRHLIYTTHKMPVDYTSKGQLTLRAEVLEKLATVADDPAAKRSLELVVARQKCYALRSKLLKHVHDDGRFHPHLDNKQATGRISCKDPNLTAIAKEQTVVVAGLPALTIANRNTLRASPGYKLVSLDVAGADVRCLAHEIDRCKETTEDHHHRLTFERFDLLPDAFRLSILAREYINKSWRGDMPGRIQQFYPSDKSPLVETFRKLTPEDDLYAKMATEISGREIRKQDAERSLWKTVCLAQLNGQSAGSLASAINCTADDAANYIERLFTSYPDIGGWLDLARQQVQMMGRTYSWGGRNRTDSAMRWMVSQPRVRLLMRYHSGRTSWLYWLDVTPVSPARRYLTAYVHRIWNTKDERGERPCTLIYHEDRGRIGTQPCKLDTPSLFKLPFRNLPWKTIVHVQLLDGANEPLEQADYEGFDATCRQLVNMTMQGGTVDVVITFMLRMKPVCQHFGARLLLNIHDELVFETPIEREAEFIAALVETCRRPPEPEWRVPIGMKITSGERFGEMKPVIAY